MRAGRVVGRARTRPHACEPPPRQGARRGFFPTVEAGHAPAGARPRNADDPCRLNPLSSTHLFVTSLTIPPLVPRRRHPTRKDLPALHARSRDAPLRRRGPVPTGVPGLDSILEGDTRPTAPTWSRGGRAPARPRWPAIPPRRGAARRALPLHHPVGESPRAGLGRRPPRLVARRDRDLRAGPARTEPRSAPAAEPRPFLRPRTRRDRAARHRGDRPVKPQRVVFDSLSEIRLLSQARCATAGRFWRSAATC